jgi:uracil-DNA glycosylase
VPGVWVGADSAADLGGVAAWADAAGGKGAVGRIAAAGESGGAGEPDRGVAQASRGGGETVSATDAAARREELVALYKEVSKCTKCPLHETRTKTVFGAGNADADLMFVGEAPGAEEDRQGLPFVGRAGQLLNQLLGEIGLSRDDVFICNVLKSRPPNNRDPQPGEIAACEPYLFEQVRLIQPRVVCTLGNFATKLLTGSQTGITRVRGTPQTHELGGRPVYLLPLFHPAAALRTPAVKEQLRGDFATIPALLQQALPEPMPSAEEIAAATAPPAEEDPPPADQLGFFGGDDRG